MTATETPDDIAIDEQAAEALAGRLFELFTGAALSALIDIARRAGLFDVVAVGPATSAELAHRAGLQERYVREWLGAMATAGIVEYDPDTGRFWLLREHAACLTGDSPQNLSGLALLTSILADHVPGVTDAFRNGGGVLYDAFAPEIHDALDQAQARATDRGVTSLTFEQADAAELRLADPFDAVVVFNAVHDQARPGDVPARVHDALVPGGTFVVDEPRVSSRLEDNLDNPMAPFTHAVSTLRCLTVSLAAGGAGLGTAWGEQLAVQMLHDAGFGPVDVHDAPGDPDNAVFVTTRDSTEAPTGQP